MDFNHLETIIFNYLSEIEPIERPKQEEGIHKSVGYFKRRFDTDLQKDSFKSTITARCYSLRYCHVVTILNRWKTETKNH